MDGTNSKFKSKNAASWIAFKGKGDLYIEHGIPLSILQLLPACWDTNKRVAHGQACVARQLLISICALFP
eukprot:5853049-Amphidinium_carterae.1